MNYEKVRKKRKLVNILLLSFVLIAGATLATIMLLLPESRGQIFGDKFVNEKSVATPTQTENHTSKISTIILPHFDGAASHRAAMLNMLAKQVEPTKIVVISVNHYNTGGSDIETTNKNWVFQNKSPKIDEGLFKILTASGVAVRDEAAFSNEHGISNALPDLTTNFPSASFLPIIIKDHASKTAVDALYNKLEISCPECVIVASVDFSHYNPASLAQIHDQSTIYALQTLNLDKLWQAETDSPQTLYLAARWAKFRSTENFTLVNNSNTGLDKNDLSTETTSYVLGYYSGQKPVTQPPITSFLIGGDAMFDRMVYHTFKTKGMVHIFDNFGPRVFWGTDISMLNLEGPISDKAIDDNTSPDSMVFTFPPETASALKSVRVQTVSLGNNHSANAAYAGLTTTKKLLTDAGITTVGAPTGFTSDANSVLNINAPVPVTILSVNTLTSYSKTELKKSIQDASAAGRKVLIFPHWGSEYQTTHAKSQELMAHEWIDYGADVIIGSHPHVVQDAEVYNKKPIIYSMGNFVFDQTFSAETMHGVLIGGIITDTDITLSFFPTEIVNYMPRMASGSTRLTILNRLLINLDQSSYTKVREDTIKISW